MEEFSRQTGSNGSEATVSRAIEELVARCATYDDRLATAPSLAHEDGGWTIDTQLVDEESEYQSESSSGVVDDVFVDAGPVETLKSAGLKRREKIQRRVARGIGGFAATLVALGVVGAASTGSGSREADKVASIGAIFGTDKASVIDGGYNVGTMPRDNYVLSDIEATTSVYFQVTAQDPEDTDKKVVVSLSDRPDIVGKNSGIPDAYLFAKKPFGDPEDGTVARAPFAQIVNTFGMRLVSDEGGTIIDAVPGKPNTVTVSRNNYGIETYIPDIGDPGAPINAVAAYESRLGKDVFTDGYVSDDAYEAYAATIDGDRSTPDETEPNPIVLNGHQLAVLDSLPNEACFSDITQQLDAGLASFVKTELAKQKDVKPDDIEVEFTGAYKGAGDAKRRAWGDDQPQIDGEGDETRFSGDFMFGEPDISCDNVRVGNVFDVAEQAKGGEDG